MADKQSDLEQLLEKQLAVAEEHRSFVESTSADGVLIATAENAKRLADIHRRQKEIETEISELLGQ